MYCQRWETKKDFVGIISGDHLGPMKSPYHRFINTEHTWPKSKFKGTRHPYAIMLSDLHHLFPTNSEVNSTRSSWPFGEVEVAEPDKVRTKFDRQVREVDELRNIQVEINAKRNELDVIARYYLKYCDDHAVGTVSPIGDLTAENYPGQNKFFEPPKEIRGNIARVMLYFSTRYELPIDPVQEAYFRKWDREDPVDQLELVRHEMIYQLQATRNPFIDYHEQNIADLVEDF